jgi:hypothetical protein
MNRLERLESRTTNYVTPTSFEEGYDEINRTLREIAADLEMEPETLKRVYVGSGEDYSEELRHEYVS